MKTGQRDRFLWVSFPFYAVQTTQIWLLWPSVSALDSFPSCTDTKYSKNAREDPTLSVITGFRLEQDSVRAGSTVTQNLGLDLRFVP